MDSQDSESSGFSTVTSSYAPSEIGKNHIPSFFGILLISSVETLVPLPVRAYANSQTQLPAGCLVPENHGATEDDNFMPQSPDIGDREPSSRDLSASTEADTYPKSSGGEKVGRYHLTNGR